MIELINQLFPYSKATFLMGFVVFLRVGALMALLPAFGEASVPIRVRLALSLMITLVVMPLVAAPLAPIVNQGQFVGVFWLSEILAGLLLGIIFRLLIILLQVAASIAAQSMSLSQILGSAGVEPQPAIGHLLVSAGLALAVISGLHIRVIQAIVYSYTVLPVAQLPSPDFVFQLGLSHITKTFSHGLVLAMPFVIASFIYNLALGVINRAMPQLMVALVGAPAITFGGLALMLVCAPAMLEIWINQLTFIMHNPFVAPK